MAKHVLTLEGRFPRSNGVKTVVLVEILKVKGYVCSFWERNEKSEDRNNIKNVEFQKTYGVEIFPKVCRR